MKIVMRIEMRGGGYDHWLSMLFDTPKHACYAFSHLSAVT